MNISLSPELETMIHEKVEAGEYHDASEVVSEALRIMAQHDKRTKIRALRDDALAQAIAEADRGETVELTDELWDQLMAEGDARARLGKSQSIPSSPESFRIEWQDDRSGLPPAQPTIFS